MRLNALAAALALNLALAGALVWLWSGEERFRWAEPEAMPPSLDDGAATEASEPAEVSRYRETLDRPLFVATRKIAPRPSAGAESQAASDALTDVRLLGTYGSGDRVGIVIVRGGKVERIPVGSSIGDWKVAGEDGRGAALVRANGERRKLDLALSTAPPPAPTAGDKAIGPQDATQPASAPAQPRGADAVKAASPPPAPPVSASDQNMSAINDMRRQRLERVNARRAQQGLPPLE